MMESRCVMLVRLYKMSLKRIRKANIFLSHAPTCAIDKHVLKFAEFFIHITLFCRDTWTL